LTDYTLVDDIHPLSYRQTSKPADPFVSNPSSSLESLPKTPVSEQFAYGYRNIPDEPSAKSLISDNSTSADCGYGTSAATTWDETHETQHARTPLEATHEEFLQWTPKSNLKMELPVEPELNDPEDPSEYLSRTIGAPISSTSNRVRFTSPPHIRTSTLQQIQNSSMTVTENSHFSLGTPGQQFDAYALYPHKAKLEIQGDLDALAEKWTAEEVASRRRLVHFTRSQSGNTVSTSIFPIFQEKKPRSGACISCIYWEGKRECFVTSVNVIYLLEQLAAARFTVEEKNRIRRNLEEFRPLIVAKGKSGSEQFWKVIMAFPAPKPRNIEKDIKVFRWKDLSSILKKIIGKHVRASSVSTARNL
jgi:hypothetical protein